MSLLVDIFNHNAHNVPGCSKKSASITEHLQNNQNNQICLPVCVAMDATTLWGVAFSASLCSVTVLGVTTADAVSVLSITRSRNVDKVKFSD